MQYSFNCYGHRNITAKHKTTLEFTKDKDLSLRGDCIVGIKADFSFKELKKSIKSLKNNKIRVIIRAKNVEEKINAEINTEFSSDKELVIRKTDFISGRTFAVNADKAAFELRRNLAEFLKVEKNKIKVTIQDK